MEDTPAGLVMEACINLAEAHEFQLRNSQTKRDSAGKTKTLRGEIRRVNKANVFKDFLEATLKYITPSSVHNAVIEVKNKNPEARSNRVFSFINGLTVSAVKDEVKKYVMHCEYHSNADVLKHGANELIERVIRNLIRDCLVKNRQAGGIGVLVSRRLNGAKFYSPAHSS